MHFWLKFLHIAMVSVWFTGLFFLPRLFIAHRRGEVDAVPAYFNRTANLLYFRLATPAAALAILLGMLLLFYAQPGAWLALKLVLVAIAVLIHVHYGLVIYEMGRGRSRHSVAFFHISGWLPLILLLALAALTAAKPRTLQPWPAPPPPAVPPAGAQVSAGYSAGGSSSSASASGSYSP